MSKKYISQIINQNFVYPNNEVYEYDIELVQDINDNSVSGSVSDFTVTFSSSSMLSISMDYTWNLNGAEKFVQSSNRMSMISIHAMSPTQLYYKPFRTVYEVSTTNLSLTTYSQTGLTFDLLPSDLGLTGFTEGTYNFEVRFIGHTSIYPVCLTVPVTFTPVPTPTPTPTPGPNCYNYTVSNPGGSTRSVTYTPCSGTTTSVNVPGGGDVNLGCVREGTIFGNVTIIQGDLCGDTPTPTPTSTPTSTPTPTPTPTSTPAPDTNYVFNLCYDPYETAIPSLVKTYAQLIGAGFTGVPSFSDTITISGSDNVDAVYQYAGTTTASAMIPTILSINEWDCSGNPITPSTPTPTPTSTPVPPTPTPTSTSTPTPTPTPGPVECICYEVYNPTESSLTVDYYACDGSQPIIGIPGGSTDWICVIDTTTPVGDSGLIITQCDGPISCTGDTQCFSCGATPTPTPTPTVEPTPTPTLDPGFCTSWEIINNQAGTSEWSGQACTTGAFVGGTVGAFDTIFTPCIIDGTLLVTGGATFIADAIC